MKFYFKCNENDIKMCTSFAYTEQSNKEKKEN